MKKNSILFPFLVIFLVLTFLSSIHEVKAVAPTIYGYDSFESLSNIGYVGRNDFNAQASTAFYQYGTHSLYYNNDSSWGSSRLMWDTQLDNYYGGNTSFPNMTLPSHPSLCLGQWIYFNNITNSRICNVVRAYNSPVVDWFGVYGSWDAGSGCALTLYYTDSIGGTHITSTLFTATVNNWYWVEVLCSYGSSWGLNLYVNGTSYGGSSFESACISYFQGKNESVMICYTGGTVWKCFMDYLRLADIEEFPPSYPQARLYVNAYDYLSNSSITGQVLYVNDSAYSSPANVSVNLGDNYTVSFEQTLGYNGTHVYTFKQWQDGSNGSITSMISGDTTLSGYFTLSKIPDYSSTITFGIGLFGFILIGLSWVVGYHFYKEGDYQSMFFWGFLMLIFGYGLIWVIFGG